MAMLTDRKIIKTTIFLSLGLYIAALTQPAYCTKDCANSFMTLLVGWLGILMELGAVASWVMDFLQGHSKNLTENMGAVFTWLANPLFFLALFFVRFSNSASLLLSVLTLLLMLSFSLFDKVISSEAGHYDIVKELKIGYWLWLLSALTIIVGNLILLKTRQKNE